jgi:hypothetical protein
MNKLNAATHESVGNSNIPPAIVIVSSVIIISTFFIYFVCGWIVEYQLTDADGIAFQRGFSCYRDYGGHNNYTDYVICHEACHQMINEDREHFCGKSLNLFGTEVR